MKADILDVTRTQDDFGNITRAWALDRTIDCDARGIIGGGIRVVGSTETFATDYEDVEWVKMKVSTYEIETNSLTKRMRVTNIRRSDDDVVVWKDDEGEPTIFNIEGMTPFVDPFGNVSEYELLLKGETGD